MFRFGEGHVGIYACGPTVYNYFHIGNARPFIVFDTLRRYLEYRGYHVTFVQNFTDIDDKMIRAANEQGITVKELADKFIAEYYIDAKGFEHTARYGASESYRAHPRNYCAYRETDRKWACVSFPQWRCLLFYRKF